jgi:hypothetical protein
VPTSASCWTSNGAGVVGFTGALGVEDFVGVGAGCCVGFALGVGVGLGVGVAAMTSGDGAADDGLATFALAGPALAFAEYPAEAAALTRPLVGAARSVLVMELAEPASGVAPADDG